MHFLHNELREALGDESEALCYLDLYHSKNVTKSEYEVAPSGELQFLNAAGKAFNIDAEWLTLHIQKDYVADEQDAVGWAYKLCRAKDICGKDAEAELKKKTDGKKNSFQDLSKKEKVAFMREFLHSMFPIHPPKVNPRDFSDDPQKASGEFKPLDDRPPQIVEEQEMRETYEQLAERGGINVKKTIRISDDNVEKPLVDEDY